jgi:uncharacterized caspase-like protein
MTKPKDNKPLFIRLTQAEHAAIAAYAATVLDERGRPLPTSTWARRVLMAAAKGQP